MMSRAEMSLASLCQRAAAKPSIRDLMASYKLADEVLRTCLDAEWNDANDARDDAEVALLAALVAATGLTRAELSKLGSVIL